MCVCSLAVFVCVCGRASEYVESVNVCGSSCKLNFLSFEEVLHKERAQKLSER